VSKEQLKESRIFTYEVKMICSVFETDDKSAQDKLNREGGFVSKRTVSLLDSQPIIS
jgi:hypothetical protein